MIILFVNKRGGDKETSELLYSTLFCHFKEPLYLIAKIREYREKKEFPLSYFHRVVFCMTFCF